MSIFQEFTAFFHQDALMTGNSFKGVARAALDTMTEKEVAQLREFLDQLRRAPSEVIERTWNSSKADFFIRGERARDFIQDIILIIDACLSEN
jgi:hypothetical protein